MFTEEQIILYIIIPLLFLITVFLIIRIFKKLLETKIKELEDETDNLKRVQGRKKEIS